MPKLSFSVYKVRQPTKLNQTKQIVYFKMKFIKQPFIDYC